MSTDNFARSIALSSGPYYQRGTRSGVKTYARSTTQLKTLGADTSDGLSLIDFVDPNFDDALLAGDTSSDLKPYFDNAIIELNAVRASRGGKQRLLIPPFVWKLDTDVSGPLNFNTTDLVTDAHGATLFSPTAAFTPPIQFSGAGDVWGMKIHFSGLGPNYLDIVGPVRFHNVDYLRDWTANVPMYLEPTASGFEWHGGSLNAYGGLNSNGASHVLLDGVFFTQPDSFLGTDDAIAIKATDQTGGPAFDWRITNCRFRNKGDFVGFGTQLGKIGANDPSRSIGIYGVTISDCQGENCASVLLFKPGAIFDTRDGVVQGVTATNLVLRDPQGILMNNPIEFIPDKGAVVRDVSIRNLVVEGRFNGSSGTVRAAIVDFDVVDSTGVGANVTKIERVYLQGDFNDINNGAASGGTAPASPAPWLANVEKATGYGDLKDITLNLKGNGTLLGGASVGANLDNSIYIERLHATNLDANGSSSFGGIVTASIVNTSTDLDMNMAAGSAGLQFALSGSGDVRTRGSYFGITPVLPIQDINNTVGAAQGSISFLDSAGAEYAWVGDRDAVNQVLSLSSTGSIALVSTQPVTLNNAFVQTASNVTSSITNSSGNPTNVPAFQLTRANNINTPTSAGACLTLVDHELNWSLVLKNVSNVVRFSVGPAGNVNTTGVYQIGGTTVLNGQMAHIANLTAAPTAADFNNLLAELQAVKLMA